MDISKFNKGEVLAALYNNSKVQGMGFLQADNKDMTIEEANQILLDTKNRYFDYLKGRVMKVDLAYDELDTRLYNRDNGEGAAERILSTLTQDI